MSHMPRRVRTLFAALAGVLALAGAAHSARAAEGPVVTGLNEHWVPSLAFYPGVTFTISGSGFTDATNVSLNGSGSYPFEIVSDHTIKATIASPIYSNTDNVFQVTAGGLTSPPNPSASFRSFGGPPRSNTADLPVTCSIGGGSAFTATLESAFKNVGYTIRSGSIGDSLDLGPFNADLKLGARPAGVPDPLADVVGEATVTSVTADVTGGGSPATLELSGDSGFSFRPGTSVDGNPLIFKVADSGTTTFSVTMPTIITTVDVDLHAYEANVNLASGGTSTLRCTPQAGEGRMLSIGTTAPAPSVTSVSPSSLSSSGTSKVRITGRGFVQGMPVSVSGVRATGVTVVSSTRIDATLPSRPAGVHKLEVGSPAGTANLNYVGSTTPEPFASTIPLTCTFSASLITPATVPVELRVTGQAQPSVKVGESVGFSSTRFTLHFAPDAVDALRAFDYGTDAYSMVELPSTIGGTTYAGETTRVLGAGQVPVASPYGAGPVPAGTFADLAAGAAADIPLGAGNFNDALGIYDLGVVTPGTSAVTASLRPFEFDAAGPGPVGDCTPTGHSKYVNIPVAGTSTPSPTVSPTPSPTVTPSPSPTPSETTAKFGYALQGSTRLNTLTKGSMPLTGSIDATLGIVTGNVTADLQLNDTQGRFTALGFLPVTAAVGFVPSGQTTGKLTDDQLTTTSKVRIKVKSVKAFGAIPLVSGNSCQTKSLSTIALKSTDAFDPTGTGGTLAGTYAISDLNGCGPLNGLVSPITAGAGNTITVKLIPKG